VSVKRVLLLSAARAIERPTLVESTDDMQGVTPKHGASPQGLSNFVALSHLLDPPAWPSPDRGFEPRLWL
jgi:hypothetical protein